MTFVDAATAKADKVVTNQTATKGSKGKTSSSKISEDVDSRKSSATQKALKDAKITEARVTRLGQKRAVKILDLADIAVADKKQAPAML